MGSEPRAPQSIRPREQPRKYRPAVLICISLKGAPRITPSFIDQAHGVCKLVSQQRLEEDHCFL